ncbi:MAG TPA: hypothetical protein VM077_03815 [Candidatus Limnocylindrales bacterium]|nr:hypothetical protein [Candidatus Limnocylindrales bacterium]
MQLRNISKDSKIIFIYYCLIIVWGSTFYFLGIKETAANYWYQFAFGLIPLIGGIWGMTKAKQWGMLKSKVGRAMFFMSLGAFSWGIGQMFWSIYYNILQKIDVPYPSLADVGYSLSFPFLAIGLVSLSKASGARISLKHVGGKILAAVITIIATFVAYYLLIVVARGGVIDFEEGGLKLFFDLAYPLGDLVILLFALLIYGLSFNYLGGRYKYPILSIILGLLVLFFGDFSFSYTTTVGTYYNGHWVDIILPTAWMLIVFGINCFDTKEQGNRA